MHELACTSLDMIIWIGQATGLLFPGEDVFCKQSYNSHVTYEEAEIS